MIVPGGPSLKGCSKGWWAAVLVLLTCDLLKCGFLLAAEPPAPGLDALQYWQLARRMAAGDWFLVENANAFRTPGYPAFLALFMVLFGDSAWPAALVAQHGIALATSFVTGTLALSLSGRTYAFFPGYLLSALGLVRAWYANLLLTETLFTFLLICSLAALTGYARRQTLRRCVLLGLCLGAATLVRPVATLVWIPCVIAMLMIARRETSSLLKAARHGLGHIAVVVALSYVVTAPWYARNQVIFGRPFLTEFLGRNLWVTTFKTGSGAGLDVPRDGAGATLRQRLAASGESVQLRGEWSVSNALAAGGMRDDHIDDLMGRVAIQAWPQNWPRVIYQNFRRTVNFWRAVSNPFPFYPEFAPPGNHRWGSPRATTFYRKLNRWAFSRSLRWNELALLGVLAGLAALVWRPRLRPLAVGFGLVLLYFNLTTAALQIPDNRYRMILEPIMIVCFVGGLGALMQGKARSAGRPATG